ncbi:MAG TPA: hypothetical protein PKI11_15710, partial [Candidatus Hydrogenedentes bacterium]|nr:hypothetical protein [Candidatus Hydrogenedentota bacterium]
MLLILVIAAVFSNGGTAWAVPPCPAVETIDAEGQALYAALLRSWDLSDVDGNGMIDSWETALLAEVLCRESYPLHSEVRAWFDSTVSTLRRDPAYGVLNLGRFENAIAALILLSWPMRDKVTHDLYLARDFYAPYIHLASGQLPFSAQGDPDVDGLTNYQEYDAVRQVYGSRSTYVWAALTARGIDSDFASSLKYLYELEIPA